MKIFADENIPFMTVKELRRLGHEVVDIRGTEDEGRGLKPFCPYLDRNYSVVTGDREFKSLQDQVKVEWIE